LAGLQSEPTAKRKVKILKKVLDGLPQAVDPALSRMNQGSRLGKPPTDLITERVMIEAKRSIVYEPTSLSRISYDLGYEY
jgi:hypothetical protein